MAVTASAEIRPSTEADRPRIAAVLDRLFVETPFDRRRRLWDWRGPDNPAGDGRLPEFLVVEREGRLVGVHGLFPLRLKVGDRVVRAAVSCDFAVAAEARSLGMPLKLEAMRPELAEVSFTTSANGAAHRIASALGGVEVPWARTTLVKPLRVTGLVRDRLRRRLGRDSSVAEWTARLGTPVDAVLRRVRAVRRRRRSPAVEVGPVDFDAASFADRFDGLWSRLAPAWPVAVARDADYLRWRYGRYPFAGVEALAARAGSETAGFAALHHHTDVGGLGFVALLDLFAVDDAARRALLAEVVRRADERGAHYITARSGAGDLRDLLEARGFLAREADHCPYNCRAHGVELERRIAEPSNWRISQGDGDSAFLT